MTSGDQSGKTKLLEFDRFCEWLVLLTLLLTLLLELLSRGVAELLRC